MPDNNLFAKSLELTIELNKNLRVATHKFKYVLGNFSGDTFTWDIPKEVSSPDIQVENDGENKPGVVPSSDGTQLIVTNLIPVPEGQNKTIEFSYTDSSGAFISRNITNSVAFYRAEIFHSFPVMYVEVKIRLPRFSRLLKEVGAKSADDHEIKFIEKDIPAEGEEKFPIFFIRRNWLSIILAILTFLMTTIASIIIGDLWDLLSK